MSDKTIIGYQIIPIYPADPGMVMTACLNTCDVTGKIVSSMGGGGRGYTVCPEVIKKMLSPEGKAFFSDLGENYDTGGAAVL